MPTLSPGLRAMVLGAFWFSVMSVLVKLSGARLPAMQVVLARAVVTLILSVAMLHRARVSPWGQHRGLLALRGVLGSLGLVCFYTALTRLPLAEATVVQYTNPVLTAVLAAVLLRERAGWREAAAAVLGLLGVVSIARPGLLSGTAGILASQLTDVGIAFLGAMFSSLAYVTVRAIGRREHPLTIVFYLPLIAVPLALPLALPVWVAPTPIEWAGLLAVGVTTQIAQVYMTMGLQREPAGRATAAGYVQILFAGVWGALLFGELPGLAALGGAALVLVGVGLLATNRAPVANPDTAIDV